MTDYERALKSSLCCQFAADVVSGKIVSGVKRVQACQRFLRELELAKEPGYRWSFDLDLGYRPIRFIEQFCKPTKGDYDRMELLPWQHFIEANLFGWVDKETGYRRFREGLILVGSGNGKSTLIVGNAIYGASKDGERGAECYCIANAKDQAKIIYNESKAEIETSPLLKKHFRTTRDGIYYDKTNSVIQALASDPSTLDGKNVHLAIFDEVHDYRSDAFINVLKKKIIKRRQPLVLYISTMGTVVDGPLMSLYEFGAKILAEDSAISPLAAERMFVYIDEIDEEDHHNLDNIDCWGKANPSLGRLLHLEDLIVDWETSKRSPSERSNFINKQLNVFTSVDEMSFLDAITIKKNNQEYDLEKLMGALCYGGFDLSETEDFTSACLEFPLPDNWFFVLEHSWTTEKKRQIDAEKLDWNALESGGWLTVVPGEYVDFNLVYQWFLDMRELYRIESIGYDPAKAFQMVQKMQEKGFVMNPVRQGELTLTAPLDDLKERFLDGKIMHNKNPMYTWYLGNVKLTKRSANATYLPTKQSKSRKIDGFAAHLDAHTEYLRNRPLEIPKDKDVSSVIRLKRRRR